MAKYINNRVCSLCGKEKECTTVCFIPVAGKDTVTVKPYTGVRDTTFPGEFYMHACADCGMEKGKSAKGAWITVLVGYLMMFAGIALCASVAPSSGINGLGIFIVMVGWIMSLSAGCVLVFKARFEMSPGGMFLPIFALFFPFLGLLALAVMAKKINRCARAASALKAEAEAERKEEREKDEALAQRMESGIPLTEEEQRAVEERKQEKEAAERQAEYARAEQADKANKGTMTRAVISIIFTVLIGIYGASVYSSGRGYMTLFRTIELSPLGFAAVIAVLIIWDIAVLVSALKNRNS